MYEYYIETTPEKLQGLRLALRMASFSSNGPGKGWIKTFQPDELVIYAEQHSINIEYIGTDKDKEE